MRTEFSEQTPAEEQAVSIPIKRSRRFDNAYIDMEEASLDHFAQGLNFYKLFLISFIGSFVGVVVELGWCLIKNGYIESRSGLVYGPFNALYGIGALVMTLSLYRYRNKGPWCSFIGGFLVGSVFEYFCSWAQEMVFGSRSWNYRGRFLNINGRVCLVYSLFWGMLGMLWIKCIYPAISKLILMIPNNVGKIITWILVIFMIFNITVTCLAVYRWSQRLQGLEPSSLLMTSIDREFPNERMQRIFPNMSFFDQSSALPCLHGA